MTPSTPMKAPAMKTLMTPSTPAGKTQRTLTPPASAKKAQKDESVFSGIADLGKLAEYFQPTKMTPLEMQKVVQQTSYKQK